MRYKRNPEVVLREEDSDGGLLFNPDTDLISALNVTGLFTWQLCDGEHDLAAIVTAIRDEFDGVPAESVEKEVSEFLNFLVQTRFIGTVAD